MTKTKKRRVLPLKGRKKQLFRQMYNNPVCMYKYMQHLLDLTNPMIEINRFKQRVRSKTRTIGQDGVGITDYHIEPFRWALSHYEAACQTRGHYSKKSVAEAIKILNISRHKKFCLMVAR